MRVYAVEPYDGEGTPDALFATRELAEARRGQLGGGGHGWTVTEYEIMEALPVPVTKYNATQQIRPDGSLSGLHVTSRQTWSHHEDARPQTFHRANGPDALFDPGKHFFGADLPDKDEAVAFVVRGVTRHLAGLPDAPDA